MIQAPVDATREELMDVCKSNGIKFHHMNSAETLRRKIDEDAIGNRPLSETPQQSMRLNGEFIRGHRPEDVRQAFDHFRRENPGKAAILRRYIVSLEGR